MFNVHETTGEFPDWVAALPAIPSDMDIAHAKKMLINMFGDVFSTTGELRAMKGEPMKIHLKPGSKPFSLTAARQVPFALRDKVKAKIEEMCNRGIIEKLGDVPT